MKPFNHIPVLYDAVLDGLGVHPGGIYIDGTVGGAGHAAAMLERDAARVIGIDGDPAALRAAGERLAHYGERVTLVHGNFREIGPIAAEQGLDAVDGVLLDIGVSSYQLDTAERGFSFNAEAPLDMRMDTTRGPTAAELINTLSEADIADIIYKYGEERASRRIARAITEQRTRAAISTTTQLAVLVARSVGGRGGQQIHPATRTFQALRIVVNDELGALEAALPASTALLKPGGRLAVISFHSLEDRIVKEFVRREAANCLLPPRMFAEQCPHLARSGTGPRGCIYLSDRDCDYAPRLVEITRKPITASDSEVAANPRSRSAKLRVAERI